MSQAKRLAAILERPDLKGATLMVDPDTKGESTVYWTGRPFWLIRQGRFGTVMPLLTTGNKDITLDTLLAQADGLHRQTGKPVVIALPMGLDEVKPGRYDMAFRDYTTFTRDNVRRFRAATRKVASLRPAQTDEEYDVYVYTR